MLRKIFVAAVFVLGTAQPLLADNAVDPQADFKAFREYFTKRFPKVPLNDFVNGPYSMDEGLRKQWKSIEELPPYEFVVERGKDMFAKPFKSGKTFGDCFPNKGIGIRQNYPYFDTKSGEVITLELALNQCREANGEKPLELHLARHGRVDGLYGLHLTRKALRHQDSERSEGAGGLSQRRAILLHAPRSA